MVPELMRPSMIRRVANEEVSRDNARAAMLVREGFADGELLRRLERFAE
jgi:hypothetical protein